VSNPLRIDVPDWEKDFDGIIRLILQLSRGSKQYGYPMPLYLAHLDARIEQKHAEWSTTQLIHYLSKNDPELYETSPQGEEACLQALTTGQEYRKMGVYL